MNLRWVMVPLVCILLVALLTACTGSEAVHKESATKDDDPDILVGREVLLTKAQQLGEGELAKLAAAEMLYRNKVYDHVYIDEDNGHRNDKVMKYFRNFRNYEVVDVQRSESLIHPVTYVIKYNYDLVGTRGESAAQVELMEAAKKTKTDNSLMIHASESLVREYKCDREGDWQGAAAPMLPRPNWWDLNLWASKTGVLSVDVMDN